MFTPLPITDTAVLAAGTAAVTTLSLRFLHPAWWRARALRWLALTASFLPLLGIAMWAGGPPLGMMAVSYYGVVLTWHALLLVAPAAATLPFAAAAGWLLDRGLPR